MILYNNKNNYTITTGTLPNLIKYINAHFPEFEYQPIPARANTYLVNKILDIFCGDTPTPHGVDNIYKIIYKKDLTNATNCDIL